MKDDQRVVLTKRMLKEALLRLLKKKEIDKVSIKELCEEAGINRATFYRHYEVPRDILKDLRYEIYEEAKRLAEYDRANVNPLLWLKDICRYFYTNSEVMNVLFKTKTDDELVGILNYIYENYYVTYIMTDKEQAADEESKKLLTYFYAGGIYYIIRQWLAEPIRKTPDEVAEIILNVLSK